MSKQKGTIISDGDMCYEENTIEWYDPVTGGLFQTLWSGEASEEGRFELSSESEVASSAKAQNSLGWQRIESLCLPLQQADLFPFDNGILRA